MVLMVYGWCEACCGGGDMVVVVGGGADMCDPVSAAAGVAVSLPFMINPPSTNSWIVCHRKDRGGCGCSCRWSWCFGFCLFGGYLFMDGSYIRGWLVLFR